MWNPPHHMLLLSIQTHIDQGLIAPPSLANDTIRWYHYNGPSMADTLGNVLHKPCVIYDAGAHRTSILRHKLPTHATITHNKHQHHSQSDRNDLLVDGYCRIDASGCQCRGIIFIHMIDEGWWWILDSGRGRVISAINGTKQSNQSKQHLPLGI